MLAGRRMTPGRDIALRRLIELPPALNHLTLKPQRAIAAAAANGSNRIALRCP